jgi:VWFA-related protein
VAKPSEKIRIQTVMAKALAALSLAATIVAQSSQPTFRARADLVQVDVVVVDQAGNPVLGIKQSDFALFDRNKPQAIATFDEVSHETAADTAGPALPAAVKRDVASNQNAQAGRLIVMVIDDLHIWKDRTDRAKEIARKVLTDLGDQTSMAVLFTSGERNTLVTEDRAVLSAAVETLKARQSWRRPHQATDKQRGDRIDAEASNPLDIVSATQRTNVQDYFDNMSQYKTLQDAARLLGGGDARRKAFVLLSEGIGKDLTGLFGAMTPAGDAPIGGVEYASGNLEGLTRVSPAPYHDEAMVDMMEAMRRANVATYAIDPRGKVESKDLATECFPPPPSLGSDPCAAGFAWTSPVRLAQHGLEILSGASGGFAVTNTDDFTSGLKRIVDDLDHYYLLGFYPADAKGKDYRPLDVKIPGHPEWKLRFRHGYVPGGPPAPPKNSNEMVALASGVLPKSDLPLRLTTVALPGSGSMTRIAMALEVSAVSAELRESDGRFRDTLKYEVLVVNPKKAKVRSLVGLEGHLVLSPLKPGEPPPEHVAYQVGETFDLAPGHYELRVAATSAKLAKGGSVYLDLDVPDFQSAPIVLGGLTVNYADGPRVPIAPRRPPLSQRGARVVMPTPDAPPALPFPPSPDRVFSAGDSLRLYLEGTLRRGGRPSASIDVINAEGKTVRSSSASFATGDTVKIQHVLPLTGLPRGAYVLRVTLADGGEKATRETGFAVR